MRVIRDQLPGPKRFPISRLLDEVGRRFGLTDADMVRITCLGGPGENIWALESKLDDGELVIVDFAAIKSLASGDDDFF